jgi:hypothetical protein
MRSRGVPRLVQIGVLALVAGGDGGASVAAYPDAPEGVQPAAQADELLAVDAVDTGAAVARVPAALHEAGGRRIARCLLMSG